jgi:hypothetical protein
MDENELQTATNVGLEGLAFSAAWFGLLLIQLACLIHLFRTGRPYWWLWLIFGFPGIGVAAYVFFEVRPTFGKLDWNSLLWKLKSSSERIRARHEALEESSTIKNRLALADELQRAGLYDSQCEVLSEGLRGPFKDDAHLLSRLAESHLDAGRPAEAERIFRQIVPERSSDAQLQWSLLQARILSAVGRRAEAQPIFEELIARKKSEAPRYYYAEFMLQDGRRAEAIALLQDIIRQYRRGTRVWRHLEKKSFYAARRLLKAPPAAIGRVVTS